MGKWMKLCSRSIYGCGPAPEGFVAPSGCKLTCNQQTGRLYLHIFEWPISKLHLDDFAGKVRYAQLLHDASEIRMIEQDPQDRFGQAGDNTRSGQDGDNTLTLRLPVRKPDIPVPVVELMLK